jgi:hypothetical protein
MFREVRNKAFNGERDLLSITVFPVALVLD